jgi:hypothetical protein
VRDGHIRGLLRHLPGLRRSHIHTSDAPGLRIGQLAGRQKPMIHGGEAGGPGAAQLFPGESSSSLPLERGPSVKDPLNCGGECDRTRIPDSTHPRAQVFARTTVDDGWSASTAR